MNMSSNQPTAKYFDHLVKRRGTDCVKWDEAEEGVLPLWVADMDFETAPCVRDAVMRRAAHGVYGYNLVPESFFKAIISWQRERHGWSLQRDWILYTSGVVPAVSAIIKAMTSKGDGVMTFTPAYNCFFSSIRNNGCRLVDFPLTWSRENERYSIDFEAMCKVLESERPRLLLLCSPHNPTGRVWTYDELREIATLCAQYHVPVVSDEIHCEFVNPRIGRPFLPFGPIAEEVGCEWVVTNAPNKAFNTAGLQISYIVTPNEEFRARIDRAINDNEVCDVNCFSFVALEAAYTGDGAEWLNGLVSYIYEGYEQFRREVTNALPEVRIAHLEGTYLAWLDVELLLKGGETSMQLVQRLREEQRVWINEGELYGQGGFLRVNLATQHSRLEEATRRIIDGIRRTPRHRVSHK